MQEDTVTAASQKTKNDNGKTNKKFSRPLNYALRFVSVFFRFFTNAHIEETPEFVRMKKQGPMLVVCNHVSSFDFVYFSAPLNGTKFNYVVAENMKFSLPIFSVLIKKYGCITKKQYYADFQCISKIKKYLDEGISVVLCPEGKVAADGVTGTMPESIGRLIKWLGYPVASVITEGAGIARPKWAGTTRFGRITARADVLFTAEELAKLDKEEVYARTLERLSYNEHRTQVEKGSYFMGRRYAEGLEKLLYKCPKCGAEFAMTAKKDTLTCRECGNTVVYSHTGELLPVGADSRCYDRIDIWCDWQKKCVEEEVASEDFKLSYPAALFTENKTDDGYYLAAEGTLTLNREKISFYIGSDTRPKGVDALIGIHKLHYSDSAQEREPVEDEFKHVSFKLKNLPTVANIPGDSVDLYDDKHIYRIVFTDVKAAAKYAYAIECIAKNSAKRQFNSVK